MYNANLVCTYSYYDKTLRNLYHSNEQIDLDDVSDFEDFSELIYKTELLKALCFTIEEIETFREDISFNSEKVLELFNFFKESPCLIDLFELSKIKHSYGDIEMGFVSLFSYDYFFLSHKCFCDYCLNGVVSKENAISLKKTLERQ